MANIYKLKSIIQIEIETTLEDNEAPTSSTVEFLIQEDLQELGYEVNEIKTINFEIEKEEVK